MVLLPFLQRRHTLLILASAPTLPSNIFFPTSQ